MSTQTMYTGKAGQMAVMAEFLWRGWNVAIPEIDVGEDIFVVRDSSGDLQRVQVKTALATQRRYGHSARFVVGKSQLATPRTPDLLYVFVPRYPAGWGPMALFKRAELYNFHVGQNFGSVADEKVLFYLAYAEDRVKAYGGHWKTGICLDSNIDAWSTWPVITHP